MVSTPVAEISNQSSTAEHTNPIVDPYAYLGLVRNSDGLITRQKGALDLLRSSDPSQPDSSVLTKDIPINQSKNTWFRIYLPHESCSTNKLPIIVYYHGGGFVLGTVAFHLFHDFCKIMAVDIPAIVISVEYRLAPDDRLPAAYLDAVEALDYIRTTEEEWLREHGDFSRCYLMGSSAGANIAYHVSGFLGDVDLGPLKIQGLILQQPYFGGIERTESELRLADDNVLPLCVNDLMWELGLPIGADRDHVYCNPMFESGSHIIDRIKLFEWKVLVTGCDGDPLVDRQIELVKILKEKGVETVSKFDAGGCHGISMFDRSQAKALYMVIKDFISSKQFLKNSAQSPHY